MSRARSPYSSRSWVRTQHAARSRLPSATRAAWAWEGSIHASVRSCATAEARAVRPAGSQLT